MIKKENITISINKELLDEIEKRRGRVNRSLFIEDILKEQLQEGGKTK